MRVQGLSVVAGQVGAEHSMTTQSHRGQVAPPEKSGKVCEPLKRIACRRELERFHLQPMPPYARVRTLIDAAHAADPHRAPDGRSFTSPSE